MEIKHRWTQAVLYSGKATSISELLVNAVKYHASLDDASLCDASLDGASRNFKIAKCL